MVDQTAPPATEQQQQNGSPVAIDAPAATPGGPLPGAAGTTTGRYAASGQTSATPEWYANQMNDPAPGSSRIKWLGGLGGALLLAAGVGGLVFARRHRRASRRAQALQAARDSAMLAVSAAGSIGWLSGLRRRLAAMPDRSDVESAMEHNAKRASKLAKQARNKLPR
ncbi:MAG: hypothetical protein WEB13_11385 [Dehalococcoidia bacterium]